jgi:hypothetical protein
MLLGGGQYRWPAMCLRHRGVGHAEEDEDDGLLYFIFSPRIGTGFWWLANWGGSVGPRPIGRFFFL